jgi:hypothetical protein
MKGTGVHIFGLDRASATEKQRMPFRKALLFGARRKAIASIAFYKQEKRECEDSEHDEMRA